MRARALTYFRSFLFGAAIAFILLGSASYFTLASLGYRWRSDSAGSESWVGCGSSGGALTLSYKRFSKSYVEYIARLNLKSTGINVPQPTLGWIVRFIPRAFAMRWSFHMNNISPSGRFPTTGPAYVGGSAGLAFSSRHISLTMPYWCLVLVTGVNPLYRLIDLPKRRRQKRFAAGQCMTCGYDLRHSPERCPECGTARTTTPPTTGASIREMLASRREKWWQIGLYPIALAIYLFTFLRIYYSHR